MFGLDLDWWNTLMLCSLGIGALAALAVVVTTRVVIVLQAREAIKSRERIAVLEESTAKYRAENERIKSLVVWRSIDPEAYALLVSALSRIKGSVTLAYVQNDPESLNFTILVQNAFVAANGENNWRIASQPRMYTDRNVFGISVFGKDEKTVEAVKAAFASANIKFVEQPVPPPITQLGGIEVRVSEPDSDVVIMIGSRYPGL